MCMKPLRWIFDSGLHSQMYMYFLFIVDEPFIIAITICMFSFIFELIINSWSRSKVVISFKPKFQFLYEGYIFSFFWWFDLLAIVSIWPDIPWISKPLHLGDIFLNHVSIIIWTSYFMYWQFWEVKPFHFKG